jgi:hypothetical protein
MPIADDPVISLAERLLGCLCGLLPATVGGPVCVCCLNPGMEAPMDYCCKCEVDGEPAEGQAWVSVINTFPSVRFPLPQLDLQRGCPPLSQFAATLQMGVYRCAPVPDARGNPPGCDVLSLATEKILSDAAAMRQAAVCCFHHGDEGPDMLLGEWEPLGPMGGCVGGAMRVTVAFTDCCPETPAG